VSGPTAYRRVDDQRVDERVITSDDDVKLMSAIMSGGLDVMNKTIGCQQMQELGGPRVRLVEMYVNVTEDQQRRRKNREPRIVRSYHQRDYV